MLLKMRFTLRQRLHNLMFYGIMTLVVAAVVVLIICFNKPGLLISEEEAVEAVIK